MWSAGPATDQHEPLRELAEWLSPYERFWRGRLTALRALLDETDGGPTGG
jgi:hypothetical protein